MAEATRCRGKLGRDGTSLVASFLDARFWRAGLLDDASRNPDIVTPLVGLRGGDRNRVDQSWPNVNERSPLSRVYATQITTGRRPIIGIRKAAMESLGNLAALPEVTRVCSNHWRRERAQIVPRSSTEIFYFPQNRIGVVVAWRAAADNRPRTAEGRGWRRMKPRESPWRVQDLKLWLRSRTPFPGFRINSNTASWATL